MVLRENGRKNRHFQHTEAFQLNCFELWCCIRFLRISWTIKATNTEVLRKMKPYLRFLDSILQRKLAFVGHIVGEENGFDRALLLGMVYGPRGRGRPKTHFIDEIVKVCGTVCAAVEMARSMDKWRKFVKETTADRPRSNRSC